MDKQENTKSSFSQMEEEILDFWDKSNTFQRSVDKEAPNGDFVFYDGPPFATGLPHYGHLVGNIIKDV
ncbi:MAG TPA: class I tRNA ligase family protein, partial [Patescibacteria group bacterium]|nr:class I tRNA ligase family protein [Patescibacteria group bacterium]